MTDPWIVLAAAAAEAALGYPHALHERLPHPVTWLGNAISALEKLWNSPALPARSRKMLGVLTVLLVAGLAGILGWVLEGFLALFSTLAVALIATVGLAQRSLYDHTQAILKELEAGDITASRKAVGMIVGRDVDSLDESGVAAAALESLAESFCDGVIAPLFWFLLGGLPGLFIYKAVNTADSIIGHKEPRWKDFGWIAARTDDLLNLIPARLAGALIAAAGRGGWRTMINDAHKHASPNAGWPEAAMAGALNIQLGGATTYDGVTHDRPTFGDGPRATFGDGPRATTRDLRKGIQIYILACILMWILLGLGGLLWPR